MWIGEKWQLMEGEEGGRGLDRESRVDVKNMLSSNVCLFLENVFEQVEVGPPAHYFGRMSKTPTARVPEQKNSLAREECCP